MATIPRVLLSRTNESASPVCPFMALSGHQPTDSSGLLPAEKRTSSELTRGTFVRKIV
jgi:hypothetical protein